MFPILFQKGSVTLYFYGVMIAIAFLLVLFLARRRATSFGFRPEFISDFCFYVLLAGIAGARLFYVLEHYSYYQEHLLEIPMLFKGGLVFYGGLITALLTSVVLLKKHEYDWRIFADFFIPYLPLGHALGRVGCFMNGCCYGVTTLWGMHPVQLYEAILNLAICMFLLFLRHRKLKPKGALLPIYMLMYGIGRFVLEFFRGDTVLLWGPLRVSQGVSALFIIVALVLYSFLKHHEKKKS
jgi:phosphatidylglycerol:prolipoprotein diacylglycerol transferase